MHWRPPPRQQTHGRGQRPNCSRSGTNPGEYYNKDGFMDIVPVLVGKRDCPSSACASTCFRASTYPIMRTGFSVQSRRYTENCRDIAGYRNLKTFRRNNPKKYGYASLYSVGWAAINILRNVSGHILLHITGTRWRQVWVRIPMPRRSLTNAGVRVRVIHVRVLVHPGWLRFSVDDIFEPDLSNIRGSRRHLCHPSCRRDGASPDRTGTTGELRSVSLPSRVRIVRQRGGAY